VTFNTSILLKLEFQVMELKEYIRTYFSLILDGQANL